MKRLLIGIAVFVVVMLSGVVACEPSGGSFDCDYNTHKAGDAMGIAERINCLGQ